MSASTRELETLKTLRPLDLVQYLRVHQWHEYRQVPDKASYWLGKDAAGEEFEILLPLRPDFADYSLRVAEVLQTLETAEERSQEDILHDLSHTNADVVRVRTHLDEVDVDGIQLDEGVQLYQRARDLWIAAACATRHPQPAFANRKPNAVLESARNVRFGQPERGSYVLTIISTLPPALNSNELPFSGTTEPFERKTALMLVEALGAVRAAAQRSAITGNAEPFKEAVPHGVSANLCEAIVGLNEGGGNTGVEVSFSWALTRQAPANVAKKILLSPDVISYCSEAAKIFRATSVIEDVEVQGAVTNLGRSYEELNGKITVTGLVDGRSKRILISLSEADSQIASRANVEKLPVSCIGKLEKDGTSWVLRNPRDFTILNESD